MIKVICVGKIKEDYLTNLINDYSSRIKKYHKFEIIELKDSDIKEEGTLILKQIKPTDFVVSLEINGNNLTSMELARNIDTWLMNYANITFVIGGSDGISDEVKKISKYRLSFGNNTFPHGLFRGILLEQIYRSFKIINNETYHK